MSWAEIKKAVNSNLDVPLNEQHGNAVFTENGTFTFKASVLYLITAIASGGNGASGSDGKWTSNSSYSGGTGGTGGTSGMGIEKHPIVVSENTKGDITVGSGNTVISYGTNNIVLKKGGGKNTGNTGNTGLTNVNYGEGGKGGTGGFPDVQFYFEPATPIAGGSNQPIAPETSKGFGGGGTGGTGGTGYRYADSHAGGQGGAGAPGIVIIEW